MTKVRNRPQVFCGGGVDFELIENQTSETVAQAKIDVEKSLKELYVDIVEVHEGCENFSHIGKGLSRQPSPNWFKENVETILIGLKSKTSAKVALISVFPWGENWNQQIPFNSNSTFYSHSTIRSSKRSRLPM